MPEAPDTPIKAMNMNEETKAIMRKQGLDICCDAPDPNQYVDEAIRPRGGFNERLPMGMKMECRNCGVSVDYAVRSGDLVDEWNKAVNDSDSGH